MSNDTIQARRKLTECDLDRAVADVLELRADIVGAFWRLGARLHRIQRRQLWKFRKGADGTHRYRSFEQLVHHELKMSPGHAYELIDIATKLTEDQARALGKTKAALVLRAAPEDRAALIERAKETSTTTRDVAAAAQASREERGYVRPGRHAAAGKKGRAKQLASAAMSARADNPPPPAAQERVTVAVIDKRHEVKLYARPAKLTELDWPPPTRARALEDQPFGRIELGNYVSLLIAVAPNKRGDLVAVIEVQRDDDGGDGGETAPAPERRTG